MIPIFRVSLRSVSLGIQNSSFRRHPADRHGPCLAHGGSGFKARRRDASTKVPGASAPASLLSPYKAEPPRRSRRSALSTTPASERRPRFRVPFGRAPRGSVSIAADRSDGRSKRPSRKVYLPDLKRSGQERGVPPSP